MYIVDHREADAIRKVLLSGKLFRYGVGGECERFEKRWATYLGIEHACLCASGTNALTAALIGAGIGPGDEVVVPACTYMATPVAVLAAGAIPVIVDIDDSITLSPKALAAAIGPRTRAVIPVHMWGLPCDMAAIMRLARKHDLLVIEDACQAVGGAFRGRALGSIGHAGAFSFNYYKNITAGEGGAVVTSDSRIMERARCVIDCCGFYWRGRRRDQRPFTCNGSRASELQGAMLNVQLTRLPGMLRRMRSEKRRILRATRGTGLVPIRANSLDDECGSHVMYTLPTPAAADEFARRVGGFVTLKTGRHVYTQWDAVLAHNGAHHPALNPYKLKENRGCRMAYRKDMCAGSLDILARTVAIATHPRHGAAEVSAIIQRIRAAAASIL
jgi:dTDP-4-amino-4,6-dideoxygalactose transaminase